MKCKSCGLNYYFRTHCPQCGRNGLEPQNLLARFLALPLNIGNYTFNLLYLWFFIAVNVTIVTGIVNLVVYQAMDGAGGVWAHYVVGGVFALFVILRAAFQHREQTLAMVRNLIYIALSVVTVTQIVVWSEEQYLLLAYVVPALLVTLSLFAFVALALNWTSAFSFYLTLAVNAGLAVVPFVLAFIAPLSVPGCIVNYVAFGVVVLSFVNAFFLKLLSTLFRAREGNKII